MDISRIYGCKHVMYIIYLVKVACGSHHTLALTDEGEVYAWGANWHKQSDFNNDDSKVPPTMVNVI